MSTTSPLLYRFVRGRNLDAMSNRVQASEADMASVATHCRQEGSGGYGDEDGS